MTGVRTWFRAAEVAAASVSRPRIDVTDADAEIERLIRGSWSWNAGHRIVCTISAAWLDSRCRRIVDAVAGDRR